MTLPTILTLTDAENIIERGVKYYSETGDALRWIRDGKKYLPKNGGQDETFEVYCKRRWKFSQPHCQRLMDASQAVEGIKSIPIGILPENEFQVRPLINLRKEGELDLDKVNEVWQVVVDENKKGTITAKKVKEVVERYLPIKEPEPYIDTMFSDAQQYATLAIGQLDKIDKKDPNKKEAGIRVIKWCIKNLLGGRYENAR